MWNEGETLLLADPNPPLISQLKWERLCLIPFRPLAESPPLQLTRISTEALEILKDATVEGEITSTWTANNSNQILGFGRTSDPNNPFFAIRIEPDLSTRNGARRVDLTAKGRWVDSNWYTCGQTVGSCKLAGVRLSLGSPSSYLQDDLTNIDSYLINERKIFEREKDNPTLLHLVRGLVSDWKRRPDGLPESDVLFPNIGNTVFRQIRTAGWRYRFWGDVIEIKVPTVALNPDRAGDPSKTPPRSFYIDVETGRYRDYRKGYWSFVSRIPLGSELSKLYELLTEYGQVLYQLQVNYEEGRRRGLSEGENRRSLSRRRKP